MRCHRPHILGCIFTDDQADFYFAIIRPLGRVILMVPGRRRIIL